MEAPLIVHVVQHLATSALGPTENGDGILVVTIRPDQHRRRPHNIGLSRTESKRLLTDLKRLLTAAPLFLLLILSAGCSARVEVTSEQVSPPSSVAGTSTVLAVDVLPEPPPPFSVTEKEQSPEERTVVEVTGSHNTVVNVAGDLHIHHDTHIHVYEASEPTSKTVKCEVSYPRGDSVCESLRNEHEELVREWMAMMDVVRQRNKFSTTGDSK